MDIKKIKALAELMDEHGLSGIEVCEGDSKVSLSKHTGAGQQAYLPQNEGTQAAVPPKAQAAESVNDESILRSPLVGCVYLAPEPESANFVNVGSNVKKGQVLCIVEAMKVMNEFTAPKDGRITEILVDNEEMVEYAQPLFRLV